MSLQNRKPNRVKGYDYSQNGAYFITICTKQRRELLWDEKHLGQSENAVPLSEYGRITDASIQTISKRYPCVCVDQYVIMPNHVHLILILSNDEECAIHTPSIATIINQMKGYVTKNVGFSMWQKLYHDRIIRNEREYQIIKDYICINPLKWQDDCFNEHKP